MMRFLHVPEANLTLGRLWGRFEPEGTLQEIARAYDAGDMRAGGDRLIFLDPTVSADDMAVSDLSDIQGTIDRYERLDGTAGPFRSVFLCMDAQHCIAVFVYFALWEARGTQRPHFRCVETLAEAEQALGRTGLARHARRLNPIGRH